MITKDEPSSLKEICFLAMEAGASIDLSHCHYGETTSPAVVIKRPTSYYFFLAGFVKVQGLLNILEIGTNSGGSIMSMYAGLGEDRIAKSKIATIDIVKRNDTGFQKYPLIERFTGDSLDDSVVGKVCEYFEKGLDLLYIDSLHEYEHTKANIDIYANILNPKYIVLDDIRQCKEMEILWSELQQKFGHAAFDASEICKRKGAGFGVIKWTKKEF